MASTTMADLLKQAEDAGISSYSPPDGTYTLRVVNANAGKTKAQNPKFGVQYEITEGPDQGKKFWTNITLTPTKNDGTPNSMGLAISFKDLAALGAPAEVVSGWDMDAADISEQVQAALVGNMVSAEVTTRESNGYTNVNLRKIKPVGAPAQPQAQAVQAQAPVNRPF